jgi:hypothetical protein
VSNRQERTEGECEERNQSMINRSYDVEECVRECECECECEGARETSIK